MSSDNKNSDTKAAPAAVDTQDVAIDLDGDKDERRLDRDASWPSSPDTSPDNSPEHKGK